MSLIVTGGEGPGERSGDQSLLFANSIAGSRDYSVKNYQGGMGAIGGAVGGGGDLAAVEYRPLVNEQSRKPMSAHRPNRRPRPRPPLRLPLSVPSPSKRPQRMVRLQSSTSSFFLAWLIGCHLPHSLRKCRQPPLRAPPNSRVKFRLVVPPLGGSCGKGLPKVRTTSALFRSPDLRPDGCRHLPNPL